MNPLSALFAYLRKLNDPSCADASLRHAAYMVSVAAAIIWLSVDMGLKETAGGHRGIDGNWVTAFGLFLAAVTGGKVFGGRSQAAAPEPPQ